MINGSTSSEEKKKEGEAGNKENLEEAQRKWKAGDGFHSLETFHRGDTRAG